MPQLSLDLLRVGLLGPLDRVHLIPLINNDYDSTALVGGELAKAEVLEEMSENAVHSETEVI